MHKIYLILCFVMLLCLGCEWHLHSGAKTDERQVAIERYDRIEALYLTTGDVAALHQMNTDFPQQTRTLIEDLLRLGHVNDSNINTRFLNFFQDTTLQTLIADVGKTYADMSDIDRQLDKSFAHLQELLPHLDVPRVYTQIGSLDQSIVVGHGMLGISLDKYLGSDYPVYVKYGYSDRQRASMTRSFIVPDCVAFYLLSLYPLPIGGQTTQQQRDEHMGRIQHVVNIVTGQKVFRSEYVEQAARLLRQKPDMSIEDLLTLNIS